MCSTAQQKITVLRMVIAIGGFYCINHHCFIFQHILLLFCIYCQFSYCLKLYYYCNICEYMALCHHDMPVNNLVRCIYEEPVTQRIWFISRLPHKLFSQIRVPGVLVHSSLVCELTNPKQAT